MRTSSALLLSLLISFFTLHPAMAAIDDAGAAILKKQMEDTLSPYLIIAKQTGQGITLGGDITVVPKGTSYEVTLPGFAFVVQEGARLAVGNVVVKATPGEPGEYLTTMTLPSPITFYDKINTPVAEFSAGSQRFLGSWWPEKGLYTRYDAEYKNIGIKRLGQKQFSANIASIKSALNLKENSDGTFSGPNTFDLEGLTLEIPSPAKVAMRVEKILADATYDKLNRKPLLDLRKKLQAEGSGTDAAQKAAMAEAVISRMQGFMDGLTSTLTLTGLTIAGEKQKVAKDPTQGNVPIEIRLDRIVMDYSMQGIQQEKAKASIKLGFSGLKAPAQKPALAAMIPSTANLEIIVDNLPLQKISDTLNSTVKDEIAVRETGATPPDAQTLPQITSDAGMAVSIRNTFIDTPDVNATLDGRIQADALALLQSTGKMSLGIRGLDELIAKLQGLSQSDPQAAGYAQALVFFQMMGQTEKTPDGKPAPGKSLRQYNLELTREGKMLLNGSDFSMLGGMLGAGMQGAAPQPETEAIPQEEAPAEEMLSEEPAEDGSAP